MQSPDSPRRPDNPHVATALRALAEATDRLLASVDRMTAVDFAEPSLLPGWSRAHVLAHLALNSKGLAGVLTKLGRPDALPMYASDARRDSDIEQLAASAPARIADRLAVGAAVLAARLGGGPSPEEALEEVGHAGELATAMSVPRPVDPRSIDQPASGTRHHADRDAPAQSRAHADDGAPAQSRAHADDGAPAQSGPNENRPPVGAFAGAIGDDASDWSAAGTFERTPRGRVMIAAEIPYMRWREVEIHHADLGVGYRPSDWAPEFAEYVLPLVAYDRGADTNVTIYPAGGRPMTIGTGGVQITGSATDLAWWLLGRGTGTGLEGTLPALGPWAARR